MSEPAKNTSKPRRSSAYRTEQNRLAQRRYRARQKAKWEALQASSGARSEAAQSLTRQLPAPRSSRTNAADAPSSSRNILSLPWTRAQSPPLPTAASPPARAQSEDDALLSVPSATSSSLLPDSLAGHTAFDEMHLLDMDPATWDLNTPLDFSQPDDALESTSLAPYQSINSLLYDQPLDPKHAPSQPGTPGNVDDIIAAFQEHKPYHASPQLNHLRMVPLSNLAAAMANASQICPTPNPHRSSAKSPFFKPSAQAQPHLALSGMHFFSFLSPDMRPTQKQISIPHPVWIDVIPIPVFREAVLTHWSVFEAEPDSRLLKELNHDILDGAFVCWGSEPSRNGLGAPWEARSWEVRSCFLKKWGWLFKGVKGYEEMIRTSRWWALMRGEQYDDPFGSTLQLE